MDKYGVLKQYFGHDTFRSGQEAMIDAILDGRDVLGVMPTGGGKSLCYQIPALLLPGVTLVLSPLISLMKDQVSALQAAGVSAALVNSSLTPEELRATYRNLELGVYKIVYAAPERLEGDGFLSVMQGLDLSLLAVDEAHCISQWGQDFRPSYLKITSFLRRLSRRPTVAAFTATATETVRQDIARILALHDPLSLVTGFDRPNLYFDVLRPQKRADALLRLIQERAGKSGIVYCATRSTVEHICAGLTEHGIAATCYHAGLSDEERRRNQDAFQFDRKTVMVATNAFGMGINKSNVSYVIHYNMPKSLEAYYQEAGRAGRDGEAADCILLYSAADIITAKYLIGSSDNDALSDEEREAIFRQDCRRLDDMTGYCKTRGCLRGYLLDYFGQGHTPTCGNCGNCRGAFTARDITTEAQMILSCVKRVQDRLNYSVGTSLIVNVLHGSRSQRVLSLGLDRLSTYGLMKQYKQAQIRTWIDYLEAENYLHINPLYNTLEWGKRAPEVLFHGMHIEMPVKELEAAEKSPAVPVPDPAPGSAAPPELLEALKAVRTRLAQAENVPAYIICSNATLSDMAKKCPGSMEELLKVNGIGNHKASHYGQAFLDAIAVYEQQTI